jgi:hypothetical protein
MLDEAVKIERDKHSSLTVNGDSSEEKNFGALMHE